MYWYAEDMKSQDIIKTMTLQRFREISRANCLYSEEECAKTKEGDPKSKNYDPLFKMNPCWKAFFIGAQENMNPSEAIAIDESIIPFKVTKEKCCNKNIMRLSKTDFWQQKAKRRTE